MQKLIVLWVLLALTTGQARGQREPIAPLLTTEWGQQDPYNLLCPEFYYNSGRTEKCRAGCVAVSMAQVMNYYKYPSATQDKIAGYINLRIWMVGLIPHFATLSDIQAGTPLDWTEMQDRYEGNETDSQRQAVAQLMLCCGQSVMMKYDRSSSGSPYLIASALREKFGYPTSVRYVKREDYSDDEWEQLLYGELAAGRPVIYGGIKQDGGGHSFIIDGYEEPQLFHINWGSDGVANGYFPLNQLDPYRGDDGYNLSQDAIIGLQPPTADNISRLHTSHAEETVYDMGGRRIDSSKGLRPGIYIVDGRKVIMK